MPAVSRSRRAALLACLAGGPLLAQAQAAPAPGPGLTAASAPSPEPLSWFDVYGTSVRGKFDDTNSTQGEDSRLGAGATGHLSFGSAARPVHFFVDGSVQHNQFDTANFNLDQYRIGPGLEFAIPALQGQVNAPRFFVLGQFVDWSAGTHALGGGAWVGVRKPFMGVIAAYAEAGFVRLALSRGSGTLVGPEFKAGVDIVPTPDLAPNARVFVEYRYTGTRIRQNGVSNDFTLSDIRAGIRIGFGNVRNP